jgi:hypothetical protein
MIGEIGGLSGALRPISLSLLRRCPAGLRGCPKSLGSQHPRPYQGRTKVVNAVHGMHPPHSVGIPRSVGC